MSIKPIPFNTEMVKAILDGRKTQTRRVVKGIENLNVYRAEPAEDSYETLREWDFFYGWSENGALFDAIQSVKAPYAPGDILWVRETWVFDSGDEDYGTGCFMYKADMPIHIDAKDTAHGDDVDITAEDYKWHPSIHMPKEAARIFIRTTNVRLERVQDITLLDAINEGCCGEICNHEGDNPELGCTDCYNTGWLMSPNAEFAMLWDTTIKPADRLKYGWDANPWVWVIEFERCEKPEGWCKNE